MLSEVSCRMLLLPSAQLRGTSASISNFESLSVFYYSLVAMVNYSLSLIHSHTRRAWGSCSIVAPCIERGKSVVSCEYVWFMWATLWVLCCSWFSLDIEVSIHVKKNYLISQQNLVWEGVWTFWYSQPIFNTMTQLAKSDQNTNKPKMSWFQIIQTLNLFIKSLKSLATTITSQVNEKYSSLVYANYLHTCKTLIQQFRTPSKCRNVGIS